MKPRKRSKRFFSLFELFIVIMLIGLMAGGIALSFPHLINKERYEGSIDAIVSKFENAQEILFTYHCDVTVHLKITADGLICTIQPSSPIPPRILNSLNSAKPLSEIKSFSFDGNEHSDFNLHYYISGFQCPKGVLSLVSKKDEVKHLLLKGFPTKIEFSTDTPSIPSLKANFPPEILSEGGV